MIAKQSPLEARCRPEKRMMPTPPPRNVSCLYTSHDSIFLRCHELSLKDLRYAYSRSSPRARKSAGCGFSFRLDERAEKRKEVDRLTSILFLLLCLRHLFKQCVSLSS